MSETRRRPRWRSYLLLSRISNLPTIWTNVLAGMVASAAVIDFSGYLRLAFAVSCFYVGGMFLNDAFDEPFDRTRRPSRPIPAGDVSRAEAFCVGALLLLCGELLLIHRPIALILGVALAGAIVLYDYQHKGSRIAPLIMGACRGLVYCTVAAAWGNLTIAAIVGAVVMTAYVLGLTMFAKRAAPGSGWKVPLLIAGISLVDAVFITVTTLSPTLAFAAALGFPLTLAGQRVVPGD